MGLRAAYQIWMECVYSIFYGYLSCSYYFTVSLLILVIHLTVLGPGCQFSWCQVENACCGVQCHFLSICLLLYWGSWLDTRKYHSRISFCFITDLTRAMPSHLHHSQKQCIISSFLWVKGGRSQGTEVCLRLTQGSGLNQGLDFRVKVSSCAVFLWDLSLQIAVVSQEQLFLHDSCYHEWNPNLIGRTAPFLARSSSRPIGQAQIVELSPVGEKSSGDITVVSLRSTLFLCVAYFSFIYVQGSSSHLGVVADTSYLSLGGRCNRKRKGGPSHWALPGAGLHISSVGMMSPYCTAMLEEGKLH